MDKSSLIALKPPALLQFYNNSALMEGGAIYSQAVGSTDTYLNNVCIFESLGSFSGNAMVNFSLNLANNEDNAIFVGSPESCLTGGQKNLLFGENFFYCPNKTSQVLSSASSIVFGSNPNMTDGKHLKVMLGEVFYLIPNATDVFKNRASLSGNLELTSYNNSYKLVGPNVIGIDNYTHSSPLYIIGPMGGSTESIC